MQYKNKRPLPNIDTIARRVEILKIAKGLSPIEPNNLNSLPLGLECGNKKTKTSGRYFNSVFVWNMPLVITCPGASSWCLGKCYNADCRKDVYPINKWCENLWWFNNNPKILKDVITSQIVQAKHPVAIRFHSCGDFFSVEYIEFWLDIIQLNKDVRFWGYTRSWSVTDLNPKILELASLKNVNLYASWDITMKKAPLNMVKSIVIEKTENLSDFNNKTKFEICSEQFSFVEGCADCAKCIFPTNKDVVFIVH